MNTFGKIFRVEIFGESHGKNVGILLDGVKPGLIINEDIFKDDLAKRKAGILGTTARIEEDRPIILSGVFNGHSTGAPLLILFENKEQISKDYSNLINHPRPGHADFVAHKKYQGFEDYRGGGHFSGRLTAGIVAGGVVAKKMLPFTFKSEIVAIKNEKDARKWPDIIEKAIAEHDSVGGVVKLTVSNLNIGLGEPYFDSLESMISHILFSIGGVKAVSFGNILNDLEAQGSNFNDLIINKDGKTATNNSGGINGGISNGNEIVVYVYVKPTSSIMKQQQTYNFLEEKVSSLEIAGRHDAAIIQRIPIVLENALAIALCDSYLIWRSYQ